MAAIYAVQATKMVQYTGSNSAEIITLFTAPNLVTTLVSEAAGVLTLRIISDGGPYEGGGDITWLISQNNYISCIGGCWVQAITPAQLAASWIVKAGSGSARRSPPARAPRPRPPAHPSPPRSRPPRTGGSRWSAGQSP
jgi:hypothetical protein